MVGNSVSETVSTSAMMSYSSKLFCFQGLPCHLYFDLEFNRRVNIDNNEDEMIDLLLSIIFKAFHEKYSIQGNLDWIVELDSSTEGKLFSNMHATVPNYPCDVLHLCL